MEGDETRHHRAEPEEGRQVQHIRTDDHAGTDGPLVLHYRRYRRGDSGVSAASAATTPSNASDRPKRSPTRSRRVTNNQLVARLTIAPSAKAVKARATVSSSNRHFADQASGSPR